jgi:hypothetical protein
MKTVVVSTKVEQPTFGDTDDELGVTTQAIKKQKVEKKKSPPAPKTHRLQIASRNTIHGVLQEMDCMGHTVRVYPLNYTIKASGSDVEIVPCHAYRKGSPAENYDVDEKDGWDPGHAEMEGIAVLAYEIAEWLCENEGNAVVVVSNHCGDATRLLAGCAAQAVRRLLGKTSKEASAIVGSQASKPRSSVLKKVYEDFGKWTKITARANITSMLE